MRAASRIALRPFSGSTPAWAARPVTVIDRSTLPLRERHDVAVRARALEDEAGVGVRRERAGCAAWTPASRSPRRGWRRTRGARTAAPPQDLAHGGDRVQAGEQSALHVGDARARRDAVLDGERALRHRPGIEHRVHVADAQERRAAGVRPAQLADDRLAQVLVVRVRRHRAPRTRSRSRGPAADLVDAGLRVAAAVGVDEPLEVGEVGRVGPLDARPQRGELFRFDEGDVGAGHAASLSARCASPRGVRAGRRRDGPSRRVAGPCDSWRFDCSRAPTSTGCCR